MEEHSDGMREADHLEPPESVLAPATARTRRQAKASVRGWDTKADSIGKIGLDRERFVGSVLGDVYGDREKCRWSGQRGALIREVDEPKPTFPRVERGYTRDASRAQNCAIVSPLFDLTTDALAPEGMALEVGCSRHGVGS